MHKKRTLSILSISPPQALASWRKLIRRLDTNDDGPCTPLCCWLSASLCTAFRFARPSSSLHFVSQVVSAINQLGCIHNRNTFTPQTARLQRPRHATTYFNRDWIGQTSTKCAVFAFTVPRSTVISWTASRVCTQPNPANE
jgi:hypothetical protein